MNVNEKWRRLGWRHPLWDYVRFYSVVQKQKAVERRAWRTKLESNKMEIDASDDLPVPEEHVQLFFEYLDRREHDVEAAAEMLRIEKEALTYCDSIGAQVTKVRTQSQDHHQSSAAMVAAVSFIAGEYCLAKGMTFVKNPQRRCVWLVNDQLHVTARNLDGAIPSLHTPDMMWEIKEYWGKTKGGSKMSDAVYECALVGRELRDFEERSGAQPVPHVVFLDGKDQWSHRRADLRRFVDLFHQGLIDHLIVGREVESEWEGLLKSTFP